MLITDRIYKLPFIFVVLIFVLVSGRADAQEIKEPELLKAVMIVSLASEVDTNASDAVQGYLTDLPVDLVIERSDRLTSDLYMLEALALGLAERHQAKVVFAADFAHQNRVFLYVSLPKVGTTLLRSIDCTDETVESRFEAVAMVIRGILQAMVKGGEIGVHKPTPLPEQEEPPPPAPAPAVKEVVKPVPREKAPSPSAPKRPWLGLSTSYTLAMISEKVLYVHAIRTGISCLIGKAIRVFAAYRLALPFNTTSSPLALDVYLHPIELGGAFEWRMKKAMLEAGAALVLDPVSWRVTSRGSNVKERADNVSLRAGMAPYIAFGWLVSNTAIFYVSVSSELYFFQREFRVKTNSRKNDLLDLWRANPCFQVGLRLALR